MDKKPKFYYGYIIVVASTLIFVAGYGTYFSYSIFFNPLLNEFGWSRVLVSGAFSSGVLVTGVTGIVAGRISDRIGPTAVSIFSSIFVGSGFILMSFVHSLWQTYLIYGLVLAAGFGGLYPTLISSVARWFEGQRGLMTGIVSSGVGLGSIIFAPLISYFISTYNFRTAYLIIGIIVLVVMVTGSLFLKRGPYQTDFSMRDRRKDPTVSSQENLDLTYNQAIRTRQFWIIVIINFLFGFSQFSVTIHIVPYAIGQGISALAASTILAVIGAASILGRMITGLTSDKIHPKTVFISILVLLLVSLIWLEFARNLAALYFFALIFGLAYGGASTLQSLIAIEFFGLSSLGMLLGTFGFSVATGGAIGPVVAGFLFDVSGQYDLAFIIFIVAAVVALTSTRWLSPVKRRKIPLPV